MAMPWLALELEQGRKDINKAQIDALLPIAAASLTPSVLRPTKPFLDSMTLIAAYSTQSSVQTGSSFPIKKPHFFNIENMV